MNRVYDAAPPAVKRLYQRARRLTGADIHAQVDRLALRHLVRYQRANDLVAGRAVLDVACGSGYGSMVLANAASYVGLDLDFRAVRTARGQFPEFNFELGSIYDLPYGQGLFGAVVSFETLEHVSDPNRALREICRVLAPGGLLIGSIPINHPDLVYHHKPYTAVEAFDIFTTDGGLQVVELKLQADLIFEDIEPLKLGELTGGTLYAVLRKPGHA